MTDFVSLESARTVAVRLKEARLATGLSTRAVAEQLASKFGTQISHTAISKYETMSGNSSPPLKLIATLAQLYERPLDWFLDKSKPLTGIRYRDTSSRVLVGERHQYETQAQHWLEAYSKLEQRLGERLIPQKDRSQFTAKSPLELARRIRTEWGYRDCDPVCSVVHILESFGIRVIELSTQFRIDGLTARFGDEIAIVLNPLTSHDRCRLNAAHEAFHALNGDCDNSGKTTRAMEDHAFEFACNLLIPETELRNAFEGQSAVRLVQAKEKFGISMAAMIYRAEKLKIISEKTAKRLWIQFAKRGWRSNEPGSVRPDRAIRFETILDKGLALRKIKLSEAVSIMGVTRNQLEERMRLAMGCTRHNDEAAWKGEATLRLHDDERSA